MKIHGIELVRCKRVDYLWVSQDGDVYSIKRRKFLSPRVVNGYLAVLRNPVYVHKLVADAFVPNPNKHRFVRFKDGNKGNVNFTNLEWYTPKIRRRFYIVSDKTRRRMSQAKIRKPINSLGLFETPMGLFPSLAAVCRAHRISRQDVFYKIENDPGWSFEPHDYGNGLRIYTSGYKQNRTKRG